MCLGNLLHSVERSVTLDELQASFFTQYPDVEKDTYLDLFNRLQAEDIGEDVAKGMLDAIRRRKEALKLSETLFSISQGHDVKPGWEDNLVKFLDNKDDHQDEIRVVSTNLEELVNETYQQQGLRWRLECLNRSLGSLRKGDFGFIFARPETGKTTFLASELSAFLGQSMEGRILWLNNEEQGSKVMLRVFQAYFGVPLNVLLSNVKRFNDEFNKRTNERFIMIDEASLSKRDIELLIKKYQPIVTVYDQIDKIKGFSSDREDLRLGSIYQWARELAKNSHAAIGVCQADGTAEGVRYLTMEHVANAKTAKQAEADWILGIGKTHDIGQQNVRYLNISKNKLFGDPDSDPQLKHGQFQVLINPSIARYEDVVTYS